ncbi:ATP-binding protein [Halalkalibaculum sp. DA3122]|uniref:ATP-binding protein n=1 Tax=Halalkalibaculum sp. DA3122 TaxID=3373607 RepID=UPI0037549752
MNNNTLAMHVFGNWLWELRHVIKRLILAVAFCFGASSAVWGQQGGSIERIKANLENLPADSHKVNILNKIGRDALDRGQMDSAEVYFLQAQHLADSLGFLYGQQQALLGRGERLLEQQQVDSAERVLERAMALDTGTPLRLENQNLLATAYRYQGENHRAIELYKQALADIDTTEQARRAAGFAMNMAGAYMNLGYTAEAFRHFDKGISYAEAAQDSVYLATALNNVGLAYNNEEQFGEASYYLQRALRISRALDSKLGELRALLNLGITRSGQSEFAVAESLYNEALELSAEVRPNTPPVRIRYNLGELYHRMEQYDRAEEYFQLSLENSRTMKLPQGMFYNISGLGNVAEGRGDLAGAVDWHTQALEVAERLDNLSFLREAHEKLYQVQKKRQQFQQALGHLETLKSLTDSLHTQRREQMLTEYQTRLEVQRKDQRNRVLEAEKYEQQAQLRFQYWLLGIGVFVIAVIGIFAFLLYRANREKNRINSELESQKRALEETNKVQNKLFGVVAHDLRNPLSALIGMLELIRSQTLSKREIESLVAELELSLQQNVNIMENLLVWAKQQMSGLSLELESINAKELADDIVEAHKFNAEHKQVELKNNIPGELVARGDYNMLKLVLRNLVSNGLKFSEEGDKVTIDARARDGEILFEVRDTGIGIPENMQPDIFGEEVQSRKGTRRERGSGMGLKLCREFVERQGGTIWFESEEGRGTTFYFTLPSPADNR